MAYKTLIYKLLETPQAGNPNLEACRKILVMGSERSTSPSTDIKQLLRVTYQNPVSNYLKIFVDSDIQFRDTTNSSTLTSTTDFDKIYLNLARKEGWFEEEVLNEANPYVHWEILGPLRERAAQYESGVELIAIATTVYCLAANQVRLGGRQLTL